MGCGPVINGKQRPITPWQGSWAQQQQQTQCPKCPHGKGFHCTTCWPKHKEK